MSEYPYLWLTYTQEGDWQFIPMNEAQLHLLSLLGVDLTEVEILPSSFDTSTSPFSYANKRIIQKQAERLEKPTRTN